MGLVNIEDEWVLIQAEDLAIIREIHPLPDPPLIPVADDLASLIERLTDGPPPVPADNQG